MLAGMTSRIALHTTFAGHAHPTADRSCCSIRVTLPEFLRWQSFSPSRSVPDEAKLECGSLLPLSTRRLAAVARCPAGGLTQSAGNPRVLHDRRATSEG